MIYFNRQFVLNMIKDRNPNVLRDEITRRINAYSLRRLREIDYQIGEYYDRIDLLTKGEYNYYRFDEVERAINDINKLYNSEINSH